MSTPHEAKLSAERLLVRLRELGVPIKLRQAYEGVAAVHNYTDWNRYSAHLGKAPSPSLVQTPVAVSATAPARSSSGRRGQNNILMFRPGEGKTHMLAIAFADALLPGKDIPIFIDCDGGIEKALPEFVMGGVSHISVRYDANGDVLDMPLPPANARGILLTISPLATGPAGRLYQKTQAFCNLATIISTWPSQLNNPIGHVFVDDFHTEVNYINSDLSNDAKRSSVEAVKGAIRSLEFYGAQLTLAMQPQGGIDLTDFGFTVISSRLTMQYHHERVLGIDKSNDPVIVSVAEEHHVVEPLLSDDKTFLEGVALLVNSALAGNAIVLMADTVRTARINKVLAHHRGSSFRAKIRDTPAYRSGTDNRLSVSKQDVMAVNIRSFLKIIESRHITIEGRDVLERRLLESTDWCTDLADVLRDRSMHEIRFWYTKGRKDMPEHLDHDLREIFGAMFDPEAIKAIIERCRETPAPGEFVEELKAAGIKVRGEQALLAQLQAAGTGWCAALGDIMRQVARHGFALHGIALSASSEDVRQRGAMHLRGLQLTIQSIDAFRETCTIAA